MFGLQVNDDKSTAVWKGPLRNSRTNFKPELNFTWNSLLGVLFSTSILEIVLLNYENKFVEMRKLGLLNTWARRHLTPFGKLTVIKSLALSKLIHVFINLPAPNETFLNDLNFFYIVGRRNRIKIK